MIESGAKYSSRQWMIIAFLGVLILASLFIITDFSGLGVRLSLVASGKPLNYLDTVDFPDIDELDGLFPDEDLNTDNSVSTSVLNAATITLTPTLTTTPTLKPTITQAPKKVTPTKTVAPTPLPATTLPTTTVRDYSKPWEVAPGCPATTLNCVPCTSGTYCRYEPGETHGFLGGACQNNNPGNIRPAPFKNVIISNNGGTPPCGQRGLINNYGGYMGEYMVFADYISGWNALKAYIKGINNGEHSSYANQDLGISCGNCPLTFFFSVYSPDKDNNLLASSYAEAVAADLNISSNSTISWIVLNKLDAFVDAIKTHEGFFTQ